MRLAEPFINTDSPQNQDLHHTNLHYSSSCRRLARRGGVKRISATVYDETRKALKSFLEQVCSTFHCLLPPSKNLTFTPSSLSDPILLKNEERNAKYKLSPALGVTKSCHLCRAQKRKDSHYSRCELMPNTTIYHFLFLFLSPVLFTSAYLYTGFTQSPDVREDLVRV